ncbi:Protein bric-a-brac [Ooceraea biroi]|uniref:Protein bric-a-brac n=1 Tax=Ooceraea biroi TaxID=2015173 RepID=A0A026WSB7_OOCBI|nr:Protein bric-a-brac [Ooceraea biroi]
MTQQSGAGSPQQFCLRWNNYQTNLTNVFDQLLQSESFVDVTLACDGHSVKAHKMVLSACSPYFQALFFDNPCQHPIVIMKDIKWPELKAAVEFMYKGEINVSQEQIGPLLKVAESLKIRGLADVNNEHELISSKSSLEEAANAAMRKKRRRMSGERSPSGNSPDRVGSGSIGADDQDMIELAPPVDSPRGRTRDFRSARARQPSGRTKVSSVRLFFIKSQSFDNEPYLQSFTKNENC